LVQELRTRAAQAPQAKMEKTKQLLQNLKTKD
jgi:hypothetical protein